MMPKAIAAKLNLKAFVCLLCLGAVLPVGETQARDAAFLDPGASNAGAGDDALKVEPKAEIDTGESVLSVAKREDVFFVNQTNLPVKVEKITLNNDGNVTAEISSDDCSKQGVIAPLSRCSVEISVTPSSPGPWETELLLTHDGAGRITRAKLTGKTSGSTASSERKDTGLAMNSKESTPVNFGDVSVGGGKAVRSALMVNDSPDPITIYSIDVIEADNGLVRLDQGCAVDMELKPGESCPVTLVWTPENGGQISTDLIIRHSGRLGFAVVPIRGNARGLSKTDVDAKNGGSPSVPVPVASNNNSNSALPPPPSADDLAKAIKIPQVSSNSLGGATTAATDPGDNIRLIGTVGNRAVILKPDGTTAVADVGDEIDIGDKKAKITAVSPKSVDILYMGKKKTLTLAAAMELTSKAQSLRRADAAQANATMATMPALNSIPIPPAPGVPSPASPGGAH